ncbi:hypothetical protein RHS01_08738 [Rhizoctonia solani]|uniref:Uncharacterized protein n=1 Tax=Rhizoctonia solani TaxID=456999 RepID=A0A8H7I6J6_9AGAM|nr:hypothetical protein RHS01_08738 [Rhizoctonia solani]
MALIPPSSVAFDAPVAVPSIHVGTALPLICSALIAFAFAFLVIAMFFAVGWHRGSTAIRDLEKAEQPEPVVEQVERRSIAISVVSDTEVFSSGKKN